MLPKRMASFNTQLPLSDVECQFLKTKQTPPPPPEAEVVAAWCNPLLKFKSATWPITQDGVETLLFQMHIHPNNVCG